MNQDMNEQTLKEQEQFLEGTVSVREILACLDQDRYLSLAQASEYLGISTRTLRDRDDLPRYRVGKKILLFKKSELVTWLERYREGGKDELDELVNETLAKVI